VYPFQKEAFAGPQSADNILLIVIYVIIYINSFDGGAQ
jgi:hypothetical protein